MSDLNQMIGGNGNTYRENYDLHEKLLADLDKARKELDKAVGERNGAASELEQQRSAAGPEELKSLQERLVQADGDVEKKRDNKVVAETALGTLELAAGPEQAAWLEERLPPPERKNYEKAEKNAEIVQEGTDLANQVADVLKDGADFVKGGISIAGIIAASHLPAHQLPDQGPQYKLDPPVVTAGERPGPRDEQPSKPDLDKEMAGIYTGPTREKIQRAFDDAQKTSDDIDRANNNAAKSSPPVSREEEQALAEKHLNKKSEMDKEFKQGQQDIIDRGDRLNTDPLLTEGYLKQFKEQDDLLRREVEANQKKEWEALYNREYKVEKAREI